MKTTTKYSPEVREQAVRLVLEHQDDHELEWAAICSISAKIGCTAETLRRWVRRGDPSSLLAESGGRGAGDAGMDGLVQPPTATGAHREQTAGRSRSDLLSATFRVGPSGMTHTKEPPEFPGRFKLLS